MCATVLLRRAAGKEICATPHACASDIFFFDATMLPRYYFAATTLFDMLFFAADAMLMHAIADFAMPAPCR